MSFPKPYVAIRDATRHVDTGDNGVRDKTVPVAETYQPGNPLEFEKSPDISFSP